MTTTDEQVFAAAYELAGVRDSRCIATAASLVCNLDQGHDGDHLDVIDEVFWRYAPGGDPYE